MKLNLNLSYFAIILAIIISACSDKDLPSDPVLTMPVTGLRLEVSGEDYTAVPSLGSDASFTGELMLPVKIPARKAVVKEISLLPGYTSPINVGDELIFTDNICVLEVNASGNRTETFNVVMQFNPPPFFYFVKTSDRDEVGDRYYLNPETQARIASGNYDNYFEGEVDLTASNWDNVGLVSEDLSTIYNLAAGPWPAVSSYSWTPETKSAAPGSTHFKTEGPWNDWLVTNGNPDIISPGVWRCNYDTSANIVDMTMTQWAVFGTALESVKAMTYDPTTKSWNINTGLTAGAFHFETIPVSFGDPTFRLGYKADILGDLAEDGNEITVVQSGDYSITLTLSNAPYYTYTLTKL